MPDRLRATVSVLLGLVVLLTATLLARTAKSASLTTPRIVSSFLQTHCAECHDAETKKAGLDLTALKFTYPGWA